jgi:hypothetical protein
MPGTQSGVQINRSALCVDTTDGVLKKTMDSGSVRAISDNSTLTQILERKRGQPFQSFLGVRNPVQVWNEMDAFYGKERGWSTVAWGFYGSILVRLETTYNATRTQCPVYAYGYDWRKSILDSGDKLKAFVADTLKNHPTAKQCIVVTHSMGGLVLRAALMSGDTKSNIRGVIHTVQPSNGAVVCYTRFFSGVTAPVEQVSGAQANVLSTILGMDGSSFSYNMSGLPGPLQLLPNQLYQKDFGEGQWLEGLGARDLADIYTLYASSDEGGLAPCVSFAQAKLGTDYERTSGCVVRQFGAHIGEAKSFHEKLVGASLSGYHSNTFVLYSDGLDTMWSVRFNANKDPVHPRLHYTVNSDVAHTEVIDEWTKIAYVRKPHGDGTVPNVSAKCPEAPGGAAEMPAVSPHSDVFSKDELFNDRIIFYVNKIRQASALLDGNDAIMAPASAG